MDKLSCPILPGPDAVVGAVPIMDASHLNRVTVNNIGGGINSPPLLTGFESFNIYFVPEPSVFALAGLGAVVFSALRPAKGRGKAELGTLSGRADSISGEGVALSAAHH